MLNKLCGGQVTAVHSSKVEQPRATGGRGQPVPAGPQPAQPPAALACSPPLPSPRHSPAGHPGGTGCCLHSFHCWPPPSLSSRYLEMLPPFYGAIVSFIASLPSLLIHKAVARDVGDNNMQHFGSLPVPMAFLACMEAGRHHRLLVWLYPQRSWMMPDWSSWGTRPMPIPSSLSDVQCWVGESDLPLHLLLVTACCAMPCYSRPTCCLGV